MNIRMASRAFPCDVGKYQLHVALSAAQALVHAANGEACGIVIKFGEWPDRLEALGVMAISARRFTVPMRAASSILRSRVREEANTPQSRGTKDQ